MTSTKTLAAQHAAAVVRAAEVFCSTYYRKLRHAHGYTAEEALVTLRAHENFLKRMDADAKAFKKRSRAAKKAAATRKARA